MPWLRVLINLHLLGRIGFAAEAAAHRLAPLAFLGDEVADDLEDLRARIGPSVPDQGQTDVDDLGEAADRAAITAATATLRALPGAADGWTKEFGGALRLDAVFHEVERAAPMVGEAAEEVRRFFAAIGVAEAELTSCAIDAGSLGTLSGPPPGHSRGASALARPCPHGLGPASRPHRARRLRHPVGPDRPLRPARQRGRRDGFPRPLRPGRRGVLQRRPGVARCRWNGSAGSVSRFLVRSAPKPVSGRPRRA
ncbi:hypothetical protein [Elioraea thermophila]|uniref:hypothetical protein n=1 Tax=Elioraea thermophila TaxID=2185104 RepID=UPI0013006A0A|nr:hypothetical protein [Elioraea thermophila]